MKLKKYLLPLLVAMKLLPGALCAQDDGNILRNGSFSEKEDSGSPAGWSIEKDSQPWTLEAPSETNKRTVITFTVKSSQENYGAVEQHVKVLKKNTNYTFKAQVKASQEDTALLMVKLLDASGKELKRISSGYNTGTEWETLRINFDTENADVISVLCRYFQDEAHVGSKISFADASLKEKQPAVPKVSTIFVSPSGKSGASGTKDDPINKIQEALDLAVSGTTVHLMPGVYQERVRFNEGGIAKYPVTLEGETGSILDASSPIELKWEPADDIGPGVFKAALAKPVITVTVDGKIVTILNEKRVDPENVKKVLERGKNKDALGVVPENVYTPDWAWPIIFQKGILPSGWEGVKALTMYSEKRHELILRIRDGLDPRKMKITVAPRLPAITVNGVDRCVVRGLTIRNAWQGVLIERSIGSVVEDCRIEITDHGVYLGKGADRCTVRFNEISQDPYAGASPRMVGWWDNWLAVKEGGFYDRIGIKIHATVGGHSIHDNYIHDHWDGIEDTGKVGENKDLDVHHNRIFRLADDGLEPNGAEENCRWHDNWIEETCCGFRIKTVKSGPLYAYRNIFFGNKEDYRCFVPQFPAQVFVYHNTSTSKSAITYNKVQGIGTPNYWFLNNIFWCERWWSGGDLKPNWHGEGNVFVRRGQNADWDKAKAIALDQGVDQKSFWLEEDPGFTDAEKNDVRLKENSPARSRSIDMGALTGKTLTGFEKTDKKSDAGAIQYGDPLPEIPRKRGTFDVPPAGFLTGE